MLTACSISDDETRNAIRQVLQEYHYLLDPHGAVGYLALQRYLEKHPGQKGIFAETAHPVKFYDVVEPLIHQKIALPDAVKKILDKKKQATKMEASFEPVKAFLLALR